MKKCVFAGTFDPFTVGHADTVKKSLQIFDEVIVAVADNPKKNTMFTAEERKEMISSVYRDEKNVKVCIWDKCVVDLLEKEGTPFYVRGLRNANDYEYENLDFFANRDLFDELVCIYIPCEKEYLHVSSTFVKNCIYFEKEYKKYVPREVYAYLKGKEEKICLKDK